jgi:hypothetical protein
MPDLQVTLRYKPFNQIVDEDLLFLIRNEVSEKQTLEYKKVLPYPKSDKDKLEFLKDISSFANARGGYLIYGIEAIDGIPKGFAPIPKSEADKNILRLHEMVAAGIRPRIYGINIRDTEISSDECVIIVKIPPSHNKPHMVWTDKKLSKFYSRNSKGVYQMDVDEIKAVTLSARDLVDRVRLFRNKRIESISSLDTPISTTSGPCVVLHIIPFSSFDIGKNIDLEDIVENKEFLKALGNSPDEYRYNFDGYLGFFLAIL